MRVCARGSCNSLSLEQAIPDCLIQRSIAQRCVAKDGRKDDFGCLPFETALRASSG
jgi:hypothetical protein